MDSLQPAGNGLPSFERGFLTFMLKAGALWMSNEQALELFVCEAETIKTIVDEADFDFASQQVLVPRYLGMEDSSRNWSLFMVLQHLCVVNREILRIIDRLNSGVVPRVAIEISAFKPDPDCGAETIDQFRDLVWDFDSEIRNRVPLSKLAKFSHPWFGPLNAHGWLCLAAYHQRIHRKQARKIVALLGQA